MSDTNRQNSRFFRFEANGGHVVVESFNDSPQSGPVSRRGVIEDTGKSLQEALSQLSQIIKPIEAQAKERLENANQVCVEFSVKITAEAGIIIAKSQLEGNFKIAITWIK